MADFEGPSFSLGLDCDLFDSEPQVSSVSEDGDYENLIVDDSEPEFLDPHPKLKRLRRTISNKRKVELNSSSVADDEGDDVFCLQEDRRTEESLHTQGVFTNQPGNRSRTISGPRRRLLLTVSDSDSDDHSVNVCINNSKCNRLESIDISTTKSPLENFQSDKSSLILNDSLPPAFHYFFHDDQRIQELVQSRLPNFSPLFNLPNKDLEHPSTSEIDYMGQFNSSKQGVRNINDKKISRKSIFSRKEKIEEASPGWVNPKLCVDKVITTKVNPKRKVHAVPQSAGYWLTGADGKRVYVGKKGQELTGRVAYMQYKKESGSGFKKGKRKFARNKKK